MAYAPAALRWLAAEWEAAIGSAVFSGIVGDAAHTYGYHRAANEIPRTDYSRQLVGDRDIDGIDMNAADAIDMSMSTADMKLVTGRIYRSWIDQDDPRLNFWREAIGTLDGSTVIYMDCQLAQRGSADNSHLWHVHCGGLRVHANNYDAAKALLSVIRGETVAQWQSGDDMGELTNPVQRAQLQNAEQMLEAIRDMADSVDRLNDAAGHENVVLPNAYVRFLKALRTEVQAAKAAAQTVAARPSVQPAPVDPAVVDAAIAKALSNPTVLAAIAKAVNDDSARRQQA